MAAKADLTLRHQRYGADHVILTFSTWPGNLTDLHVSCDELIVSRDDSLAVFNWQPSIR